MDKKGRISNGDNIDNEDNIDSETTLIVCWDVA
jgi:hypothetical protein